MQDATALGKRKFIQFVRKIAYANKIPYQTDVMVNGGTDTGEMHKAYDGAVLLTISIPTRYGHSHNSIIHLDDLEKFPHAEKKDDIADDLWQLFLTADAALLEKHLF